MSVHPRVLWKSRRLAVRLYRDGWRVDAIAMEAEGVDRRLARLYAERAAVIIGRIRNFLHKRPTSEVLRKISDCFENGDE